MDSPLHLQPRLRSIADLVPPGARLADVGTDHGYIPADLLLHEKISYAVATDIGEDPLAHARRTAAVCGLTEGIEFRLGDGLRCVSPEEVDTIVIAGMGGENIAAIIEAAPWTKSGKLLLLQPMSKPEILRRWLSENGYLVKAEKLVADKGVIYPILTVVGGTMPPATDAEAWGGFLLQDDPLWGLYLSDYILRLKKAVSALMKARDPSFTEKRERMEAAAKQLEIWKGEWQNAHSA